MCKTYNLWICTNKGIVIICQPGGVEFTEGYEMKMQVTGWNLF